MNRLILFLIGIVLVGIAGFAVVWFSVGRELQPHAAGTLVDLRDGKYAEVHARAHTSFQERVPVEDLEAYWSWWTAKKGKFFEILARRGVGTSTRDGTTHKTLTLEVGFKQSKMRAKFEFLSVEPDPLLTHFRIYEIGEGAGKEADRDALVERVRSLFALYDAEDWVGLYAALSFDLQKGWPLAKIREHMPARRNALGKVSQVELVESVDGPEDVVVQHFDVTYERAKGTAKVSQQFEDGRWHIIGFVLGETR